MAFHKKKSRYLGVFSSYSLLFHVAGFLALIIFSAPPPPTHQKSSPTITVKLIDAPTLETKTPLRQNVSNINKIDQIPKPQQNTTPSSPSLSPLFQVIPLDDTSATSSTPNVAGPSISTRGFAQVAMKTLIPVSIDPGMSEIERVPETTKSFTRTLLDHKAGHSVVATTPAKILYKQPPPYPKIARELGLEGKTLLRVEILQDGRPGTVKVRESCGHALLDEAAAQAIKDWKFAPAQDGLFAVRSVVDLPIRFSLQS